MKEPSKALFGLGLLGLTALGLGVPGCGGGGDSNGAGKGGQGGDGAGGDSTSGDGGDNGMGGSGGAIVLGGSGGSIGGAAGSSGASGTGGSSTGCGACATGQSCVDGMCVCPAYQTLCDGSCIPTSVDPENCGGCGVTCTGALVCTAGACSSDCPPGLTACNNSCVDFENDSAHCGACDTACGADKGCVNGDCVDSVVVGPPPPKCDGGGPPIVVGEGDRHCLGDLARTTFRWSLCSCTDLDVSAPLTTDAYDSTMGPYMAGQVGGGVGVDRDVTHWSQAVSVGGVLWVSGSDGYQSSGPASEIKSDMHLGGSWRASSSFTVRGDALVVGDLSGVTVNGMTTQVASVPNPCDCAPDQLVPVAEIVAEHRSPNNDNELIGLDPAVFEDPGSPLRLDLGCGNYYLTQILTSTPLTIAAHGRTALYIDGIVNPSAPLAFVVDATGELDIFIAGTIKSSQTIVIGSPNHPALTRTYVGGVDTLKFSQDVRIAGQLYAANSELVDWSARNEIYGSVFAGNFKSSQVTNIHYDRGVLRAGDACGGSGGSGGSAGTGGSGTGGSGGSGGGCSDCTDCGNQACVDGVCGSCTTNGDCCAPLVCVQGTCMPDVVVR